MPIYIVISSQVRNPQMWSIWQIHKVVACEQEDYDKVWNEHAVPLIERGMSVTAHMFLREPDNPFKDRVASDVSRETLPEQPYDWNVR